MEITEVRIKLMDDPQERLQAFCSITFDACFVIRDLKIIQGTRGSFVAMPSRKLTDRCPRCHTKNHLRAEYCNQCGARLDDERATRGVDGRAKLYADIAHPINCECRELIQEKVLAAFEVELERSKLPGYVCAYDDYGEDSYAALYERDEPLPVVSVGDEHASHRFEPAEEPAGPHHAAAASRSRETAHVAARVSSNGDEHDEEPFGAGLI